MNVAEIKSVGNQSIQIILPCGCKQTQHKFADKNFGKIDLTKLEEQLSLRKQFFEFCKEHKVYFNL